MSADEQAARDSEAEQIVGNELRTYDDTNPDAQAALEREYQTRFSKPAPVTRGFIPLAQAGTANPTPERRGFIPLADPNELSSMQRLALAAEPYLTPALKTAAAMGNPVAVAETAGNLLTQIPAFAGYLVGGGATAAGRALGLTDRDPAEVGSAVADAMTYHPRSDAGQHLTEAVLSPLTALNQGAGWAGHRVADVTGSPLAGALTEATGQMLPAFVAPAVKGTKAATAKGLLNLHPDPSPQALQRLMRIPEGEAQAYYDAWQAGKAGGQNGTATSPIQGRAQRVVPDAAAMPESDQQGFQALRGQGNQGLPALDGEFQRLPEGHGPETAPQAMAGEAGRQWPLRTDELPMAGAEVPGGEPAGLPQGGAEWGTPEYRGGSAARGDVPEYLSPPPPEAGNGRGFIPLGANDGAWRGENNHLQGQDPEHGSLGPGSGDAGINAGGANLPIRNPNRTGFDAGQVESLQRADRIMNNGSIAGYVDHYNRFVQDGQTIESFKSNLDGGYTFAVKDGQQKRIENVPPAGIAKFIDTLRDPAKVADLEARNQSDVVLGRKVRELDDATLAQWRGMNVLGDQARAKLARETKRRSMMQEDTGPSGFIPLADHVDEAAHQAATSPLNDKPQPSPAQIEAGTYAKGHLDLHGLPISIENPKGSIRSGTDATGRSWQTELKNHYGYFKRTLGNDGDHVDVFLGDRPESQRAFVIDQIDPKTGKYDEHKVVLGATDEADARRIYQSNHEPGWKGLGAITEMPMDGFKDWIRSGDTKKPMGLTRIAGKAVTEIDDGALARMATSKFLTDEARAKVQAEIERRGGTQEAVQDMAGQVQNMSPGAAHVGLINDSFSPAAAADAARAKPITREEVLSPLLKALGATIYEGRVKGKNRLGFFRPGLEEVRIKRKSDIEVAAHEIAHLLDDRIPEISKAWKTDKVLNAELRSISYDHSKVNEGFAEGVRLWMTQPDALQARAPKVSAFLEALAANHEYGPALKKAQEGMTSWFAQDGINRARSKIGKPLNLNDAFDGMWDKFRQSTADDLHGVYRMERDLTGKLKPNGAYESARLSRASQSIADGAIQFGAPLKKADGSFTYKGKGLEEILKPVAENLDDSLLYFVGKSAAELMSQGREHLFTKGEVDAMVRLRTPERDAAFKEYQAWNKGILDFAEAQGVINPDARALWQRTQYMPFQRAGSTEGFKGKPGDWSGIKALTGGTENLRSILGNMTANAAQLIDKAVKNEARQKIAALANEPGGGKFMVKIDPESRPVKISKEAVLDGLLKTLGIDRAQYGAHGEKLPKHVAKLIKSLEEEMAKNPGMMEFYMGNQPPAGHNVVAVLYGGKPTWYEVADPILYRALSMIDRPIMPYITKLLGYPKRIGQLTITLTPDFMAANIARDTIMGGVMSRAGFVPVIDSLKGMRLRITKDPIYKDYIANGGGLSSMFLDEGKFKAKLERFYSKQGIDYKTVLDAPDKILNFIETLGDAFEMSTRLGEYSRAIEKGENPRHAAYLGRDVSTDFAMKGDSKTLGAMYDTVMFLRPAVVSLDRLYRGVAHDPNRGTIAVKTGMLALASVGLYLLNREDPRYQDLADWDRDANWHFFIGNQHFRYPRIWEIGAISAIAERTVEKTMAADPTGLGKDLVRVIGNVFSMNWKPQILAPLAEQYANRSSFTNTPIETPGMENVQPFLRAKPGTSETLKAAGMATRDLPEALQVNPVRAEALLRGYFNTWAMYGLMATDKAFFDAKSPDKRIDEMPVARRFYSQEPPQHTKYETEFYDILEESKRLRGTLKELDKTGYPEIADQKEKSPLAGEAGPMEKAALNVSGINKDMMVVRRDATLNPTEKRAKLDQLLVERNDLLKHSVQDANAAQKEKGK